MGREGDAQIGHLLRQAVAALGADVAVAAVAVDNARHERDVHERIEHLRRLRRAVDAHVYTLPYLFERQMGPDTWTELGAQLAKKA